MATERQKLKVFYAEGSVEADRTNPCFVCAKVIDLGGGRQGVLVRTTETKASTCPHCRCALGFGGCTNMPRRGNFVVPACAACVDGLRTRLASYAPSTLRDRRGGLPQALALIEESNPQNLTKQPLFTSVRNFSGGSVGVANSIYADSGKPGLAERVVTQLALQHRDSDIAQALRAQPATQRRKPRFTFRKGGGGLRSEDTARAKCLPFDGRRSCFLETAGDAPLTDLDSAAEATLERYRGAVDKSKGKDADERLLLIYATEAAEKLAATLAHAPRATTRRTATRKADALVERILTRAKEKAALEASWSPEKLAELAANRAKDALARGGISKAKQAGTDPRDGEATVENHRTKRDDDKKKRRGKAKTRRKREREASGLDPVQTAIKRKESSIAKRLAEHKRAKEDPDSCKTIYCKTETCGLYDVPRPYGGEAPRPECPECRRGVRFA